MQVRRHRTELLERKVLSSLRYGKDYPYKPIRSTSQTAEVHVRQ